MISEKYKTTSMKVLTNEEQLREINCEKFNVLIPIFKEDYEFAKENGLNISRIIRHKFSEWIKKKSEEE
jgi:post-segregation antitoxin (ccd killing protein)